ncbi:hypothetical protein [Eisenbergiella tayi]|uniref:hypothetical protein n=1 Tax=Eisenbergiella tayi TaxID=1432052 RepID=UPI000848953B|nr:hypothetical protein [Eisenbergiella tayi]ODR35493.1 hypothetical protein BEI60_16325 [Eisenbergiella tayi]
MGKLIAKVPILLGSRTYLPGDTLPETDARLVEAWKRAGSCKEQEVSEEKSEPVKKVRAKRASAPSGIPIEGADEELLGKVPERKR